MPWVAGQSGNPSGRPPKGKTVSELMAEIAEAQRADAPVSRLEELVEKLFDLAIAGDVAAAKLILAYLEGMPVTRVQAEVGPMPAFTADEAAEAERRWQNFRVELMAPQRGTLRGGDDGADGTD
jgi:hypothetical protein